MEERLNDSKPLDDLKERESELHCEKEGLQIILNSENSPPSDKEIAGGRVAEMNEEPVRLQVQIEERENVWPLRDQKYGFAVTAIFLAAGVRIGAGSKVGSLCLGWFIPLWVSFTKRAGQVVSYLAEHTWLFILALVVFIVEKQPTVVKQVGLTLQRHKQRSCEPNQSCLLLQNRFRFCFVNWVWRVAVWRVNVWGPSATSWRPPFLRWLPFFSPRESQLALSLGCLPVL